ncbi:hypothetical protein NLJ89_g4142 [Agrocybe chaxingu]|uniref:Cytochrome b5 heme-binding domain-containing protein n=1 Tax=Agrocybe chaxingu TaxID=84603 RepID=A0A9W8MW77_9AGAR|nr:hypothetical protein NLJ89_g4142 [Agrocybe chaxingu]
MAEIAAIVPDALLIEVCVDSVQSAIAAVKAGADRLEVCGNLGIGGGITPTLGLLKSIQNIVDVPLMAMIRPRVGDFCYSKEELEVMLEDIRFIKDLGNIRGFTVGALTKDGRVDVECMKMYAILMAFLRFVHPQFSGHKSKAPEALSTLRTLFKTRTELVEDDVWGLIIMPGSGINAKTLPTLLRDLLPLGVREIHLSGGEWKPGSMTFKKKGMGMGANHDTEWAVWRTQEDSHPRVSERDYWFVRTADMLAKGGHAAYLLPPSEGTLLRTTPISAALSTLMPLRPAKSMGGRQKNRFENNRTTRTCNNYIILRPDLISRDPASLRVLPPHRKTGPLPSSSPSSMSPKPTSSSERARTPPGPPQIWWGNAAFFVLVHVAAFAGVYYMPPWKTKKATLLLWFLTWQLADFGITVGYHRLYSHKAFRASLGVRIVLAILGSSAFQGSIKILLLKDPILQVVRIQHKYYVSSALLFGFLCPTLLGALWNDAIGGYIWGGLVARLFIWHCTFLVNSLAHWDGLQPYSDEDTSRGNLILALLTGGEGNHNFHSFPHDFRSGPSLLDWDPSKWIIFVLHKLGLATSLRRVRSEDLGEALRYMHKKTVLGIIEPEDDSWDGPEWNIEQVKQFAQLKPGRCVVLINGFVVDATLYLGEHPGGANMLRKYSVRMHSDAEMWHEADWAFNGGMNTHSRAARKRMREFRVAKLVG